MDTCEFSDNPEKVISHREFECTPPTVVNFYRLNHQLQTFDFVTQQLERHCVRFDKGRMTVWEALEKLDRVVDESDPDLQLPQIVHAFQTAEGLRQDYPDWWGSSTIWVRSSLYQSSEGKNSGQRWGIPFSCGLSIPERRGLP